MYKILCPGGLIKIHHLFGVIVEVVVSEKIPGTFNSPYYVALVDGHRMVLVREAFELVQSL